VARLDRVVTLLAASALAVLGLLPMVNWIPGGHSADWYPRVLQDWLSGTAIVLGVGVVLAMTSRRLPFLWKDGRLTGIGGLVEHRGALLGLGVACAVLYAIVSRAIFNGQPLLIDEIIQVFQARIFTAGRLWLPAPALPEFTSAMHLIDTGGRLYGQFPAGGPAMLALGSLAGVEWLVGPVFGAVSVVLFGLLLLRLEPRPGVAAGALLLFALAPFAIFMSGSYMNHVTGLTWLLLGMLGLSQATAGDAGRFRAGLLTGLGFGVAATIRPVDALAFALPAGVWLLGRALRQRRLGALLGAGLGVAIPVAGLLWVNFETTGAPLRFGYTVMWGAAHDLGFHATPWGEVHTPVRGLELLNLYFLRLQSYLYELPVPSLLPGALALALTRRLAPLDRYLFVASALLCGLYFAYWHDGFYLGPRFMYPLLPLFAVWTARAAPALRDAVGGSGLAYRAAVFGGAAAIAMGAATGVTVRAAEYQAGMQSPRWNADRAARQAGVRGSLVLVRESWGARVIARLWAVGVSRSDAQEFYQRIDTCQLDSALAVLEAEGTIGPPAVALLRPMLADSARVERSKLSPDPTERILKGRPYRDRCIQRVREDWQGFTLFSPFILAGKDGNVFARELAGRDTLLLRQYPGRMVYLLKRATFRLSSPFVFTRLDVDSLWRSARAGE
jgi:hypothetical protein